MKLYSNTYTFSLYDKEFKLSTRVSDLNDHKIEIPLSALELHILNLEKTTNIMIKRQVMSDLKAGTIEIYATDNDYIFPSSIPILITKDPKCKLKAIINVTSFATLTKDQFGNIDTVTINDNTLFTLICTAWFYRQWMLDSSKVDMNLSFIKTAANAFTKLLYRPLDAKYSIGSIYESIDEAQTIIAYYFASYFVDTNHAADIACTIQAIADKRRAREISAYLKTKYGNIKDFPDLVKVLNENVKGQGKIQTMDLISEFGRIYNGSAIPALDYLPYLVMMIFSSYLSGGFAKDPLVNSVIKVDIDSFVKAIATIYPK